MRISDLKPGDQWFIDDDHGATFVGAFTPHPVYPSLALVIWWLHHEQRWSLDALRITQEIPGRLVPVGEHHRMRNLRQVLMPGAVR